MAGHSDEKLDRLFGVYADIFFDDLMIYVGSIDLFNTSLDQGIVPDLHSKGKRLALPVPIDIIIQVLGILIADQHVAAATSVEMVGRIFDGVEIVAQKSEMGVVDDLDH